MQNLQKIMDKIEFILNDKEELKKSEDVITVTVNPKLSKNLRIRIPSLKGE